MGLKALLFDVDGTLAETEELHRKAFNEAFKDAGLDWHWDFELYQVLLGVTGGKERILYHVQREGLDEAIFTIYVRFMDEGQIELRPGIAELIKDARAGGVRLAVTTTTSQVNVERLLNATLGKEALSWFEVYATGDRVSRKKPDPAIYLLALSELGLEAGDCLAIEDAPQGLASSLGAGIATIVTESSYSAGKDFDGALKIYKMDDPRPTLAELQVFVEASS